MKKVIFIDTDDSVFRKLELFFEQYNLNNKYSLEFIHPQKEEHKNHQLLESRISEIIISEGNTLEGLFIDMALFEEGTNDISGVKIASSLKNTFKTTLIFLYTNYYTNEDLFRFAEATMHNLDGVFPKSYFLEKFSVDKITSLFEVAKNKYKSEKVMIDEAINIGIITALIRPEFEALKEIFPQLRKINITKDLDGDTTVYHKYTHISDANKYNLIAATDDTMGMSAAASLATKMQIHFNLDCIVILGICAGMKNRTNIGDIIIPEMTWDYGKGKVTIDKKTKQFIFIPYPDQIKTDNILFKQIKSFIDEKKEIMNNIKNINRKYFENDQEIKCHFKPFASGAAVIANSKNVDEIARQHGKLIGFDMEAYGVYYAATNISEKKVIALSIKSVSDFGNEEKKTLLKSQHQIYAANNSVLFFKNILDTILIPFLKKQANKSLNLTA